jgi:hypothetical protein
VAFHAVTLSCNHVVVLVPPGTPDAKLPDNGIWTKSNPVDGKLVCPDHARVYRVLDNA